jgi:hypothetical protein
LAVHFLQSLSLHLQFHLGILLKHLGVSLSQELRKPLVGDTSCTEPRRIGGPPIIDRGVPSCQRNPATAPYLLKEHREGKK